MKRLRRLPLLTILAALSSACPVAGAEPALFPQGQTAQGPAPAPQGPDDGA